MKNVLTILLLSAISCQLFAQPKALSRKKVALRDTVAVIVPEDNADREQLVAFAQFLTKRLSNLLVSYQREQDYVFLRKSLSVEPNADVDIIVEGTIEKEKTSPTGEEGGYFCYLYYTSPEERQFLKWSLVINDLWENPNSAENIELLEERLLKINALSPISFITSRKLQASNGQTGATVLLDSVQLKGDFDVNKDYLGYLIAVTTNSAVMYQSGRFMGITSIFGEIPHEFNFYTAYDKGLEEKYKADAVITPYLSYNAQKEEFTIRIELADTLGDKIELFPPIFNQEFSFSKNEKYRFSKVAYNIKATVDGLLFHFFQEEESEDDAEE